MSLVNYCCNNAAKQTSAQCQHPTQPVSILLIHRPGGQQGVCVGLRVAGFASSLGVGVRSALHIPTFCLDQWLLGTQSSQGSTRDKSNQPSAFKASADVTGQSESHAQARSQSEKSTLSLPVPGDGTGNGLCDKGNEEMRAGSHLPWDKAQAWPSGTTQSVCVCGGGTHNNTSTTQ